MREWHHANIQHFTTIALLTECEILNHDRAEYEDILGHQYDNSIQQSLAYQDMERSDPNYEFVLSEELENEIKENCLKLHVERIAQERYLAELNEWGYNFGYLQQYDDDGNVYNISHEFFNRTLWTEESDYLHSIV